MLSAVDWQAELQWEQCKPTGGGAEQGEPKGAQHHQPAGQGQGAWPRLCLCRGPPIQPPANHCQVNQLHYLLLSPDSSFLAHLDHKLSLGCLAATCRTS